jgi:hypothetical protein
LTDQSIGLGFYDKELKITDKELDKFDVVYIGSGSKINEYPERSKFPQLLIPDQPNPLKLKSAGKSY